MESFVYIDGRIVPGSEAKISIFDLSVCRGYATFDFMRTYGKRPFRLRDHLERFEQSAKTLDLPLPLSRDQIARIIDQLLERASYPEANIKIFLTGGTSSDQYMPEDKPTFFALVYPVKEAPKQIYFEGVKLTTKRYERPYPTCKSIHYLTSIAALRRAQKESAYDILFVGSEDQVLEAGLANFFGVKQGVVVTSKKGILAGITRQVVLELLQERKIPFEIRTVIHQEIQTFDGAFITSSGRGVIPVTQIDQKRLKMHPLVEKLIDYFRSYTGEETLCLKS